MKLTEHFQLQEFASRGVLPTGEALRNVEFLAQQLEVLRAEIGDKPIVILSGYRTVAHNTDVGGAPKSQHLRGRAADIRVAGMTPAEVAAAIERLILGGKMEQGGVGIYPTFVHYDTRGTRVRWNG